MRVQVGQIGFGPLLPGRHLRAVDVEGITVVACRHRPGFLRRLVQHDRSAQVKRLRLRSGTGLGFAPNPPDRIRHRVGSGFRRARDNQVDALRRLGIPDAGEPAQRIAELFGGHAPHGGPRKDVVGVVLLVQAHRGQLVGARREDELHRVLKIVAVVGEILRQPIQQVLVPGGLLQVVHRLDQAAAEELGP